MCYRINWPPIKCNGNLKSEKNVGNDEILISRMVCYKGLEENIRKTKLTNEAEKKGNI